MRGFYQPLAFFLTEAKFRNPAVIRTELRAVLQSIKCPDMSPTILLRQSVAAMLLAWSLLSGNQMGAKEVVLPLAEVSPGIAYGQRRLPDIPWSIHVVQIDRKRAELRLESRHAGPGAVGLSTLSAQIAAVPTALGKVEAAINGDFYQRDRAYAGDSRGLQILSGELVSGPNGGVALWIDSAGNPQAGPVVSRFQVSWPDGVAQPIGLNEERKVDAVVLYTPSMGGGTRTTGGREWVLEPTEPARPLAALPGAVVRVRVREMRDAGNTPVAAGTWVLSMGPALSRKTPAVPVGSLLSLSFATVPALPAVSTALGGGPLLVQGGRRQKIRIPGGESYEFSSMLERHPRSAVGWNRNAVFLVEVDGRQKELSVGMTLEELGDFLVSLGCEEGVNLDGGGSSTLWLGGSVRNSPCDGKERPISNSLMVIRRASAAGGK